MKTVLERIWRKSSIAPSGCWEWGGCVDDDGYGTLWITVSHRLRRPRMVHRLAYAELVGPLDPELVIDHLCRNRRCFNPAHLEQVTAIENSDRGITSRTKTHCVNDHEFTPENTRVRGTRRHCRACARERSARYKARKRQEVAA